MRYESSNMKKIPRETIASAIAVFLWILTMTVIIRYGWDALESFLVDLLTINYPEDVLYTSLQLEYSSVGISVFFILMPSIFLTLILYLFLTNRLLGASFSEIKKNFFMFETKNNYYSTNQQKLVKFGYIFGIPLFFLLGFASIGFGVNDYFYVTDAGVYHNDYFSFEERLYEFDAVTKIQLVKGTVQRDGRIHNFNKTVTSSTNVVPHYLIFFGDDKKIKCNVTNLTCLDFTEHISTHSDREINEVYRKLKWHEI